MVHSSLLVSFVAALVAAFVGGFIATRLRMPPILGYLLAGVVIGPFTPGFIADSHVAAELAEVGVILLMFGVGIHFSLRDLLSVRSIALPGAIGQIAFATGLGTGVAVWWWGWQLGTALVLGLAISVASTVVLLRALEERGSLDTVHGHVAIGWLIVEDLFTVLVLVLLPALAVPLGASAAADAVGSASGSGSVILVLAIALGKAAAFVVLMLFVGMRVIPWLLVQVSRTGSREVFTLAVLAVAMGIAVGSAVLFGVSLALGAFLAGVVVSESDVSHRAAADALPMRDAFAVLFFVSVGMLFDPSILLQAPERVIALLAIVIVGKALAAFIIVALLGYPSLTGLTVAAGLAQIGEFSFILATLGSSVGLFTEEGTQLVLATALLSITLNPLLFRAVNPLDAWIRKHPGFTQLLNRTGVADPSGRRHADPPLDLRGHIILCGYGRVGRIIASALIPREFQFVVIEEDPRVVRQLRSRNIHAILGNAASPVVLEQANLKQCRILILAIPEPFTVRQIVEYAREVQPNLHVVARTYGESEREYLEGQGVNEAVLGEQELAIEMSRHVLQRLGVSAREVQFMLQGLRRRAPV